jgi:hypothetical protein
MCFGDYLLIYTLPGLSPGGKKNSPPLLWLAL